MILEAELIFIQEILQVTVVLGCYNFILRFRDRPFNTTHNLGRTPKFAQFEFGLRAPDLCAALSSSLQTQFAGIVDVVVVALTVNISEGGIPFVFVSYIGHIVDVLPFRSDSDPLSVSSYLFFFFGCKTQFLFMHTFFCARVAHPQSFESAGWICRFEARR